MNKEDYHYAFYSGYDNSCETCPFFNYEWIKAWEAGARQSLFDEIVGRSWLQLDDMEGF